MWRQIDFTREQFIQITDALNELIIAPNRNLNELIVLSWNGLPVYRVAFSPNAFDILSGIIPMLDEFADDTINIDQPQNLGVLEDGWGFLYGDRDHYLTLVNQNNEG